ncbi:MAG: FliH/SctL family protein [Armatimonadota bacterium]|nr:FliH/SctL family protein [Armatimonadota bacterium]
MSSLIKAKVVAPSKSVYVVACETDVKKRRKVSASSPQDQARAIIESAKEEAAQILENAQLEAESLRTAAYNEGYQAGLQELDAQKQALAVRATEIENEVEKQLADFWAKIEPELLKLAVEIAEKIIRHELAENNEYVLSTVKTALYQLRDRREIKIRVNPNDYELVRNHKDDLVCSFDGVHSLEIIEDRRVDQGGCVIESVNGELDARISTQLGEVERALMEAAHNG